MKPDNTVVKHTQETMDALGQLRQLYRKMKADRDERRQKTLNTETP